MLEFGEIIRKKWKVKVNYRVRDIFKILNTINYLSNQKNIKDTKNNLSDLFCKTLIELCKNFIPEYNKYISENDNNKDCNSRIIIKQNIKKLKGSRFLFSSQKVDYRPLLLDEFFYLCELFKLKGDFFCLKNQIEYEIFELFNYSKKARKMYKFYDYIKNKTIKINCTYNFEAFKNKEEEYNKLKQFNVAICATMSSGKSTFVNALLGNDYLPAKNEATTATITSVYDKDYSDNLLGCIKKGNDLIPCGKDVTLKDIENWNTDKNVSQIYLQGDLDNIGNKGAVVCVHDTPGTNNSSDSTHHDITMNFLNENKMDLIIYVSNAEHLGVNDEKQLLTEIKKLETPVLFIINKADSIDFEKEDFDKIKNQHCKYLQDIGFKNPNVLPVSAKAARLFKMSLKDKAERFTENEMDSFVSYYRKFTKRIDLSNNSNIKNPYTTNETICIESKNYNKQDIFNALNKTGITKIEQTIENYIK